MKDKNQYPIEERLWFAGILTMIAGSLDAYSFLFHGGVFAGLQTGNLILLGIHLGEYSLDAVIRQTLSILAFIIGTVIIRSIQLRFLITPQSDESTEQSYLRNRRKQQMNLFVISYEIVLIFMSIFLNTAGNSEIAAMLLSMVAAGELQEFRKVEGETFTPLTMTGDLRALAEAIFDESISHAEMAKKNTRRTFVLMFCFVIGAAIVGYIKTYLSTNTIFVSMIFLIILLVCLVINYIGHFKKSEYLLNEKNKVDTLN